MSDKNGKITAINELIKAARQNIEDAKEYCDHFPLINDITPSADGCEECLKIGGEWVNLRICLICGKVGCCDDSKNQHARKHFHAEKHALIMSYDPIADWIWCYKDETALSFS